MCHGEFSTRVCIPGYVLQWDRYYFAHYLVAHIVTTALLKQGCNAYTFRGVPRAS